MSSNLTITHAGVVQTRGEVGPAAKGVDLGANGTAFLDSDQGTDTYSPPDGMVVVAIQSIDDITFTVNTTSVNTNFASPALAGAGTNGHDMSTLTLPSGLTIYGRFTAVDISLGKAILYLG